MSLGEVGGIPDGDVATEAITTCAGGPDYFSMAAMMVAVTASAVLGVFFGFYLARSDFRPDRI
jgi:hypothetical protein